MKSLSILAITFLFSSHSFSQSLEGEWKGSFKGEEYFYDLSTPFGLHISLNKDSTYKIYSYSLFRGTDVTVVSKVACRIIGADSIYLEETKQVKPKKEQGCPQKFFLAIKNKNGKMVLEGNWAMRDKSCGNETGTVLLTKQ
ncbi:MAG TPA: hypothetical protein VK489_09670 [Ferruginibacter sp.]|nr:hypothetical protein [Ferruginibacter sp.]